MIATLSCWRSDWTNLLELVQLSSHQDHGSVSRPPSCNGCSLPLPLPELRWLASCLRIARQQRKCDPEMNDQRSQPRAQALLTSLWFYCRRDGSTRYHHLKCLLKAALKLRVASPMLLWVGGPVALAGTLTLGMHWALGLAVGVAMTFALADISPINGPRY